MPIRDDILRVLELQKEWSKEKTPAMDERGKLVLGAIPDALRPALAATVITVNGETLDLKAGGRDGTGNKPVIPFVRAYDPQFSPRSTDGWYVVYLFAPDGNACFLSLNQGTTDFTGGDFKDKDAEILSSRVAWARATLNDRDVETADLDHDIQLPTKHTTLGRQYERGNVLAVRYARDEIPGDSDLLDDLARFLLMLAVLYERERVDPPADDPSPEIREASSTASSVAQSRQRRGLRRGQGFGLSAEERSAIERHSVRVTRTQLATQGWDTEDVGATKPYDLICERDDETMIVEVKGTTSEGSSVILTRGEVEEQRKAFPNNALAVVSRVQLSRDSNGRVRASGGQLRIVQPWEIDETSLTVISYVYEADAL